MTDEPEAVELPGAATPARALPYAADGASGWPAETRAIVLCAAIASVGGLANSASVLWMWFWPQSFRRGGVEAWPVFSFTTALVAAPVLFNLAVIAGAAAALARSGAARRVLLAGGAGLIAVAVIGTGRSVFFGPDPWSGYRGPDLFQHAVFSVTWLLNRISVYALLVYAMTRPYLKGAPRAGA